MVHQFDDHLCYPNLTEAVSVDLKKENCNKMFAFDSFPVCGNFPIHYLTFVIVPIVCFVLEFANLRTEPVPTQKKKQIYL